MLFKNIDSVAKDLNLRGHAMMLIDDTLVCERCMCWAKHRNDGLHAWGDALSVRCGNNPDATWQQPDATMKPEKKRSKKK